MRNLTPSRSGVFLVDQTVPTTLPKNISDPRRPRKSRLNFREDLCRLTYITRRRRDDRPRADIDLLALLNSAPHVVFADKLNRLCAVVRRRRRLTFSWCWWWWRRWRRVHTSRFTLDYRRWQWQSRRLNTFPC